MPIWLNNGTQFQPPLRISQSQDTDRTQVWRNRSRQDILSIEPQNKENHDQATLQLPNLDINPSMLTRERPTDMKIKNNQGPILELDRNILRVSRSIETMLFRKGIGSKNSKTNNSLKINNKRKYPTQNTYLQNSRDRNVIRFSRFLILMAAAPLTHLKWMELSEGLDINPERAKSRSSCNRMITMEMVLSTSMSSCSWWARLWGNQLTISSKTSNVTMNINIRPKKRWERIHQLWTAKDQHLIRWFKAASCQSNVLRRPLIKVHLGKREYNKNHNRKIGKIFS